VFTQFPLNFPVWTGLGKRIISYVFLGVKIYYFLLLGNHFPEKQVVFFAVHLSPPRILPDFLQIVRLGQDWVTEEHSRFSDKILYFLLLGNHFP